MDVSVRAVPKLSLPLPSPTSPAALADLCTSLGPEPQALQGKGSWEAPAVLNLSAPAATVPSAGTLAGMVSRAVG